MVKNCDDKSTNMSQYACVTSVYIQSVQEIISTSNNQAAIAKE